MSQQSEQFFGARPTPLSQDFAQRAPIPGAEPTVAAFVPHTTPVQPKAPEFSAAGMLQTEVTTAEQRQRQRQNEHANATVRFDSAKDARARQPDSDDTRRELVAARQALEIAGDELEAAKGACELARKRIKEATDNGALASFEQADKEQGPVAFQAAMAPLVERATQAGRDFAAIVTEARALLERMGQARHRAITAARELGVTGYRPASIDISDAARAIGQALRAGFKEGGQKDIELPGWTRGA